MGVRWPPVKHWNLDLNHHYSQTKPPRHWNLQETLIIVLAFSRCICFIAFCPVVGWWENWGQNSFKYKFLPNFFRLDLLHILCLLAPFPPGGLHAILVQIEMMSSHIIYLKAFSKKDQSLFPHCSHSYLSIDHVIWRACYHPCPPI